MSALYVTAWCKTHKAISFPDLELVSWMSTVSLSKAIYIHISCLRWGHHLLITYHHNFYDVFWKSHRADTWVRDFAVHWGCQLTLSFYSMIVFHQWYCTMLCTLLQHKEETIALTATSPHSCRTLWTLSASNF